MTKAAVCTIGDEILIGQIVDTNSSSIARKLGSIGVSISSMLSIADDKEDIIKSLSKLLSINDIVIVTGGLGPTKDDITKDALRELFHSCGYENNPLQEEINRNILKSRHIEMLPENRKQSLVPIGCEVIANKIGTAPIMIYRFREEDYPHQPILYSMPGVPFETEAALEEVLEDIKKHKRLSSIIHKTIMTYGIAESALSSMIEAWETSLPKNMHLAYLPNPLTGVRLRLSASASEGDRQELESGLGEQIKALKAILGENIYSEEDDTLEGAIGRILRGSGKTISTAESCTGGMISHLITSIAGSSEYYLGSVVSYAIEVKEKVLLVPTETISRYGVVSSQVAQAMAEGVRNLTGSTYSVATTGLAGPGGDEFNPEGTVWIGVSGPNGTITEKKEYHSGRKLNIDRFAASALDLLRRYITSG